MSRQIIDPETGDKRFDSRTHLRDAKGRIVDVRPYTLVIEYGKQTYIDKKTGKKYEADGTLIPEPVAALPPKPSAPQKPQAAARPNKKGVAVEPEVKKPEVQEEEMNPEPILEDSEHPSMKGL